MNTASNFSANAIAFVLALAISVASFGVTVAPQNDAANAPQIELENIA